MASGNIRSVMTPRRLLAALDDPTTRSPGLATPTGFAHLDDLTGGLRGGQLWLLTGAPGQGVTTLLTQWAAQLAVTHRWRTWFASPRERTDVLAARLVASLAHIPVLRLLAHDFDTDQQHRVHAVRELLSAADLSTTTSRTARSPSADDLAQSTEPFAYLVDDADLVPSALPQQLASVAAAGALVVATVPRHVLVQGPEADADLNPDWVRSADVVLEVRTRGLAPDDPDARAGEAELRVLRHRHGPTATTTVSFQPHYGRFVDLRGEPAR